MKIKAYSIGEGGWRKGREGKMKEIKLQDEGSMAKRRGRVPEMVQLQGRRGGREERRERKWWVCLVYFFDLIWAFFYLILLIALSFIED